MINNVVLLVKQEDHLCGLVGKVSARRTECGSIPGRVIPKYEKRHLAFPCLALGIQGIDQGLVGLEPVQCMGYPYLIAAWYLSGLAPYKPE